MTRRVLALDYPMLCRDWGRKQERLESTRPGGTMNLSRGEAILFRVYGCTAYRASRLF